MSTLRNGIARPGGLLQFSTGLWWIDPLTGGLICEVQTVKGIRQIHQRLIIAEELCSIARSLLGQLAAMPREPDRHLRSEPRERAQPSRPRMLRLERAGPAGALRGMVAWIEQQLHAALCRKGDRLL